MSNPNLCALISKWLGTESWIRDIDLLMGLREYATDISLHQEWRMVIYSIHSLEVGWTTYYGCWVLTLVA